MIDVALETRKVRISNLGWLDLFQSRGAVGHAPADIHRHVTNRQKREKVTWDFYERWGFTMLFLSLEWFFRQLSVFIRQLYRS